METGPRLTAAFARAKLAKRAYGTSLKVDPFDGWATEGHAWWEIEGPEVSERPQVLEAKLAAEERRKSRRRGV